MPILATRGSRLIPFLRYCICLWVLMVFNFPAQSQEIQHVQFTTEQGLPSNCVYDISQDKEGFIWFGTDNGVAKFDGHSFQNYSLANGLTDNEVFIVRCDSYGRVWFLTSNCKPCFYYKGKIYNPENTAILKKISVLKSSWFKAFGEDKFGNVWLGSHSGACVKIMTTAGFLPTNIAEYNMPGLSIISGISIGKDGNAYILSRLGTINLTRNPGKIEKRIDLERHFLDYGSILKDNSILLGLDDKVLKYYPKRDTPDTLLKNFKKRNFTFIFEDVDNNIWLGDLENLHLFRKGNFSEDAHQTMFRNEPIGNIWQDDEKNIWISSITKGAWLIQNINSLRYSDFFKAGSDVFSMCKDANKRIWVGGDNGNLGWIDEKGIFQAIEIPKILKTHGRGRIKRILRYNDSLTALVYESYLLLMKNAKVVKAIPFGNKAFFQTETDTWLATSTNCFRVPNTIFEKKLITYMDLPQDKRLQYMESIHEFSTMPGKRVADLDEDKYHNVWLASNSGLYKYNFSQGERVKPILKYTYLTNPIKCIKIWQDSVLLLSLQSYGLGIYVREKLFILNSEQFLKGATINKIVIEDAHVLWLCTNRGLFKLTQMGNSFKFSIDHFTEKNGLLSDEVNDILVDEDKYFVGSNDGVFVMPRMGISSESEAQLSIFNARLYNDNRLVTGFSKYTAQNLPLNFKVTFGCLGFKYFGQLLYRYRMNATQPWIETKENSIYFTNLGPGSYKIEIQARTPHGKWGSSTFLPALEILPPFYKRPWFLLMVVFASSVFTIFFSYYILKNKLEKVQLDQKLTEANLKALRAQIKPHFIFNALNSVQQFFLFNKQDEGLEFLGRFSQLMRNILDGSEKQFYSLEQEIKLLNDYITIEKERIGPELTFLIKVDPELSKMNTLIPSMMLQPIVENALWHGIMKKPIPKGHISIVFSKITDLDDLPKLQVMIKDDGIGRASAALLKKKQNTGFGLKSLDEKIDLLSKKFHAYVGLKISDLKDSNGKASGTLVTLILPLHWNFK